MTKNNIVLLSARYVTNLFDERLPKWAHYHNLKHTTTVVSNCRKIGKALNLSIDNIEVLTISGWFHDAGYTKKKKNNEREGTVIAMEFLERNNYSLLKIQKVINCIMATKIPQHPRNVIEKIICDADLASLGKKTFFSENELLRKEIAECENRNIDVMAWLQRSHTFLYNHRFHTTFGKTIFEQGRQKNIEIIEQLLEKSKLDNRRILRDIKNGNGKRIERKKRYSCNY